MDSQQVCRICLAFGSRMCVIADTPLQEHYERVTKKLLQNRDGKPVMVCYICYHMLKKSWSFFERTAGAEEILQQIVDSGLKVTEMSVGLVHSVHLKQPLVVSNYTFTQYPEAVITSVEKVAIAPVEKVVIKTEVFMNGTDDGLDTPDDADPLDPGAREGCSKETVWPEPLNATVKYELVKVENEIDYNDNGEDTENLTGVSVPGPDTPPSAKQEINKCKNIESTSVQKNSSTNVTDKGNDCPQNSNSVTFYTSESTDKQHRCDQCNKSFSLKSTLNRHVKLHTGERPHCCEYCNKTFSDKSTLKRHLRVHTGDNPYRCEYCYKAFRDKFTLSTHVRVHTGEKPFRCNLCNKTFIQKCSLTEHIKMHNVEKPYSCDYCNKTFRYENVLIQHVRVHTGEKPYGCNLCNKRFSQKGFLTKHVKMRECEQPHQCNYCNKTFTLKVNLLTHMKLHGQ